ncbi:hypothetical protein K440DRAFT_163545 [Wilcoxina mikolae CBS 423.85]|nr:hypothetical protein K440DRAFT_163545 [Wilcoxina mikolae CBS 423.85]
MENEDVPFEPISIWLPLPYRILLLLIIGVWLFAFNLHYFHVVRIDISPFLRYTRSSSEPPLHRSVYQIALLLSTLFSANILLFWIFTGGRPDDVRQWEILPMMLFLMIAAVFLWPVGSWHKRGRWRFLRMFRRILVGGLDSDLRFADILLADALTSYAKVLGDAAVVVCMYFRGYSTTHPIPDRSSGGMFLVPCMIAIPYLCRLRQCITEYYRCSSKGLPARECRLHLFNAAKYASAFPVIILGAMERNYLITQVKFFSQDGLAKSWYAAVMVNTLFAFYWDVTRDWELTLLTSRRSSSGGEYPWGLRRNRHFVAPEFYYVAIVLDFALRCAWSVKLSPHLDFLNEMEGGDDGAGGRGDNVE